MRTTIPLLFLLGCNAEGNAADIITPTAQASTQPTSSTNTEACDCADAFRVVESRGFVEEIIGNDGYATLTFCTVAELEVGEVFVAGSWELTDDRWTQWRDGGPLDVYITIDDRVGYMVNTDCEPVMHRVVLTTL